MWSIKSFLLFEQKRKTFNLVKNFAKNKIPHFKKKNRNYFI